MRQVRLTRPAFINASYHDIGAVVTIGDGTALAPFMKPWPPPPAPPSPPQSHHVSVRYDEAAGEVDIVIDGVAHKFENATMKLRMD